MLNTNIGLTININVILFIIIILIIIRITNHIVNNKYYVTRYKFYCIKYVIISYYLNTID